MDKKKDGSSTMVLILDHLFFFFIWTPTMDSFLSMKHKLLRTITMDHWCEAMDGEGLLRKGLLWSEKMSLSTLVLLSAQSLIFTSTIPSACTVSIATHPCQPKHMYQNYSMQLIVSDMCTIVVNTHALSFPVCILFHHQPSSSCCCSAAPLSFFHRSYNTILSFHWYL